MNQDATTNNGPELEAALAAWCDLIDRGVNVDRNEFLEQYPAEMREELSQCLAAFDFIHAAAPHTQRPRLPSDQPTLDREQPLGGLPFRLGDYEVLEEIGRGGMGVVYRATQVSLNRPVAVKILPFAALLDGRQLDRFRNEARAAAMLKHPHIVSVLSVGYESGLHYYAMELVNGCSLAEVIRATQRPAIATSPADETTPIAAFSTEHLADRTSFFRSVARLGSQAANALNVAHEAGIVHRDIKPSNLLLDRDGRLLIADFGLARVQSDKSVTMTGDVVGTLRYMSPEQLQETHAVDHRADIYSLGVTLREMLTGQPTFGSSVRAAVITDITNGDVPKLRRIVEDVPRDLETVIDKAMSTHVDARYTNAKALEQDLIRFLEGRPVLARRAGTFEILGRWCNRNRSKAALIGLLLAMLLTAAIGGPFAAWKQKQRADAQAAITAKQRHVAYDSDMARAHQHALDGEIENTVELLKRWIPGSVNDPDYRNFEWKYLAAACETRLKSQEIPFLRSVYACELSPDEQFIAVGSWDGTICCVEVATHRKVWASTWAEGHHAFIYDLCFSADGKYLISSSYDGTIKVWDVIQGNVLLSHEVQGGFARSMAIAPNDELFCSIASLDDFQSADETTGQLQRFQFHASNDGNVTLEEIPVTMEEMIPVQTSISLSPDGKLLALGGVRSGVRILDRHTLVTKQHFEDASGIVRSIDFRRMEWSWPPELNQTETGRNRAASN